MTTIALKPLVGTFAENKDIARTVRIETLAPALARGESVILDFSGITGATQSFIHALISEPIRDYGSEVLDRIKFKNCDETVQKIITIVTDYMQES